MDATNRTARDVLNSIWVTGPDDNNTYWLTVDSGTLEATISLGTNRDMTFLKAFKEFDRQRKQALEEV